jgi:FAD/FMN-containing dehydrogenase
MSITSPITATDLTTALRAVVRGDVVAADDPSFPAACFGVRFGDDVRPELVVIAATAADLAATVRVATRAGRRIIVQTAGGQVAVTVDRTILVVTRLLAGVRVDPATRTARIGAGSSWRQVAAAADRYGLCAVPAPVAGLGSSPGSGRRPGPLGRTFSFAASHVRSLQVLTPAGELREIDACSDPDLFAAVQRAGATGWVTAMTLDLVPAEQMYAGGMWFAADDAGAVKRRWQQWSAELPAAAETSIADVVLPPVREVPAALHDMRVVLVQFVHLGDPAVAARLLDPIRAAATPLLDGLQGRHARRHL